MHKDCGLHLHPQLCRGIAGPVTAILEFCISNYIRYRSFLDCFCIGSLFYLTTVICRVLSAHSPIFPHAQQSRGRKWQMIVARWNKDRIFHVALPGKEDPVWRVCMLRASPKDPKIFVLYMDSFNFFWNAYNSFPRYLV